MLGLSGPDTLRRQLVPEDGHAGNQVRSGRKQPSPVCSMFLGSQAREAFGSKPVRLSVFDQGRAPNLYCYYSRIKINLYKGRCFCSRTMFVICTKRG